MPPRRRGPTRTTVHTGWRCRCNAGLLRNGYTQWHYKLRGPSYRGYRSLPCSRSVRDLASAESNLGASLHECLLRRDLDRQSFVLRCAGCGVAREWRDGGRRGKHRVRIVSGEHGTLHGWRRAEGQGVAGAAERGACGGLYVTRAAWAVHKASTLTCPHSPLGPVRCDNQWGQRTACRRQQAPLIAPSWRPRTRPGTATASSPCGQRCTHTRSCVCVAGRWCLWRSRSLPCPRVAAPLRG